MSAPFVAEIRIMGFNFPPNGWAQCNGQLMPLSQNTALFSLLGTIYGGDGKSNFALPNFEGSAPIHWGQGPGLSDYGEGEMAGEDFVTLLDSEIPAHTHNLQRSSDTATELQPPGQSTAVGAGIGMYDANTQPTAAMAFQTLTVMGGSQPHNDMQPYLTLNFCIALQGVFPPRS
jgi:microcystin-dependent protein